MCPSINNGMQSLVYIVWKSCFEKGACAEMILNLYLNGIDWKPNLKCPLDLQPNINWSYKPVGAHLKNKAYFSFATSKRVIPTYVILHIYEYEVTEVYKGI